MEENIFKYKQIQLHWRVRLHYWFASRLDNRVLLKQFESDLHLDGSKDNKSFVPATYPVATNEINYLYQIRDKILMRIHRKDYAAKQNLTDKKLQETENEYDLLRRRRQDEKNYLDTLKVKLKSTKDYDDRISLESRIDKASSTVKNTDSEIKRCEDHIAGVKQAKNSNLKEWQNQVKDVENTIEIAINKYIKRATRSIQDKYGRTEFKNSPVKYSQDIVKQISGEY